MWTHSETTLFAKRQHFLLHMSYSWLPGREACIWAAFLNKVSRNCPFLGSTLATALGREDNKWTTWTLIICGPVCGPCYFSTSFLTGNDRLHVKGIQKPGIRFCCPETCSESDFPKSLTCHNILELPKYSTMEKVKEALQIVINSNKGFISATVTGW